MYVVCKYKGILSDATSSHSYLMFFIIRQLCGCGCFSGSSQRRFSSTVFLNCHRDFFVISGLDLSYGFCQGYAGMEIRKFFTRSPEKKRMNFPKTFD